MSLHPRDVAAAATTGHLVLRVWKRKQLWRVAEREPYPELLEARWTSQNILELSRKFLTFSVLRSLWILRATQRFAGSLPDFPEIPWTSPEVTGPPQRTTPLSSPSRDNCPGPVCPRDGSGLSRTPYHPKYLCLLFFLTRRGLLATIVKTVAGFARHSTPMVVCKIQSPLAEISLSQGPVNGGLRFPAKQWLIVNTFPTAPTPYIFWSIWQTPGVVGLLLVAPCRAFKVRGVPRRRGELNNLFFVFHAWFHIKQPCLNLTMCANKPNMDATTTTVVLGFATDCFGNVLSLCLPT